MISTILKSPFLHFKQLIEILNSSSSKIELYSWTIILNLLVNEIGALMQVEIFIILLRHKNGTQMIQHSEVDNIHKLKAFQNQILRLPVTCPGQLKIPDHSALLQFFQKSVISFIEVSIRVFHRHDSHQLIGSFLKYIKQRILNDHISL